MNVASLTFVALAAALLFHAAANPYYPKLIHSAAILLCGYGMVELARRRRTGTALRARTATAGSNP